MEGLDDGQDRFAIASETLLWRSFLGAKIGKLADLTFICRAGVRKRIRMSES